MFEAISPSQESGRVVLVADPDAKAEAESLISRGQALDPEGPGIAPGP